MGQRSLRSIFAIIAIALPTVSSCASKGPAPDHDVEPFSAEVVPAETTAGVKLTPEVAIPTADVNPGIAQGGGKETPGPMDPPSLPARDSVIAMLHAVDIDVDALRQSIEEVTSARVERIRKGPAGLLGVHFAPLSPPRSEEDLMRLVERMRELPELRSVEPERRFRAQEGESQAP